MSSGCCPNHTFRSLIPQVTHNQRGQARLAKMHLLTADFYLTLQFFFNCFLAAPQQTLGHYQGSSLTHTMLITAFLHIRLEGHPEPRNEVGSLSPVEHLVGFEPGTHQTTLTFKLQNFTLHSFQKFLHLLVKKDVSSFRHYISFLHTFYDHYNCSTLL